MKEKPLLAVYGGAFSPPHVGHIALAEAFYRTVRPERFLIIPSSVSPHKASVPGATPKDRLQMCRLAFSAIPAEVSDIELSRPGKSYTVETLEALSGKGHRLMLLVGTDMFLTLGSWYRAADIFALAEIAVGRRETDPGVTTLLLEKEEEYRARYGAKIRFIDYEPIEISSTEIRKRLIENGPLDGYITKEVEAYIRECHLYPD